MMMRASEPPMKERRFRIGEKFDLGWRIIELRIKRLILKVYNIMADKSILKVSVRQIKAARELLAWSQDQLAEKAGVSVPTIKRLEAKDGLLGGRAETVTKIRKALENSGVVFIDENGGGPGVRLRQRSSPKGRKS
jgi:DNA-binding XRE family transcriptional regulator